MIDPTASQKPWFMQFWPWLIVLIPTLGVVAAIATLVISINAAPTLTEDKIGRFAQQHTSPINHLIERKHKEKEEEIRKKNQNN